MYQYNEPSNTTLTKYNYIWLWLQCFDPYWYVLPEDGAIVAEICSVESNT
jgi:hypothetical protein